MKTCPECNGRVELDTDMVAFEPFEWCEKCQAVVQNIPLSPTDDAREAAALMMGGAVHVVIHTSTCDAVSKGNACIGDGCYARVTG